MTDHDDLYSKRPAEPGSFRFDARVAGVFENMIQRSVPGYAETVRMSGWLASQYLRPGDLLYDLGCSLGAGMLATRDALPELNPPVRFVGVDNSAAMLKRGSELLQRAGLDQHTELQCADVLDYPLQPCRVVMLNWTLQFLPPARRQSLLQRIHANLQPGGILILSEKVLDEDRAAQQLADDLHLAFKRSQGYSELEIAGKRAALEQVLIPETLAVHRQRLWSVGFETVLAWYRQLNFASLLAVKT